MIRRSSLYARTLFPVPRFLSMPTIGLDITDRRVRFLELEGSYGAMKVKRFGEVPVAPGIIISGSIKKPLEFAAILQGLKRKQGFEFVRVSLPEERAYIVHMDIPYAEEINPRDAVAFQLEEYVPLKPDQVVFDYIPLSDGGDSSSTMHVLASVMPKEDVQVYLNVLSQVGMMPVALHIEGQAMARALIAEDDTRTHMIVDIGRLRTGVSVVRGGVVRFTSTVDVGSDIFSRAIMDTFGIDEQRAVDMKNTRVLTGHSDDFYNALSPALERLVDEIFKLYEYWHMYQASRTGETTIQHVLLTGGGANLQGLETYFARKIRVLISVGNPWKNVNTFDAYIPPIPLHDALGYATVIGLALPDNDTYV